MEKRLTPKQITSALAVKAAFVARAQGGGESAGRALRKALAVQDEMFGWTEKTRPSIVKMNIGSPEKWMQMAIDNEWEFPTVRRAGKNGPRSKASIARQYAVKDRRYAAQVASGAWPSDSCPQCRGGCCQRAWHHAGDVCLHCGLDERGAGAKVRRNGNMEEPRCSRCGRVLHPWPLPHPSCSPPGWVNCVSTKTTVAGKKARKNGTLMLVGALNKPRGARASKNPKGGLLREYVVPAGTKPQGCTPGFFAKLEKAEKYCTKFHGKPKHTRIFEYDDGKKAVTDVVCYSLGEAEISISEAEGLDGRTVPIKEMRIGTSYKAPKGSWKGGGKQFIHSYTENRGGKSPIAAIDVDTGIELRLGGRYKARGQKWLTD